jgi:hypothetical protein
MITSSPPTHLDPVLPHSNRLTDIQKMTMKKKLSLIDIVLLIFCVTSSLRGGGDQDAVSS